MGLGTLEMVGSAKVLISLLVLSGASLMDIRYRRIPDRFWILLVSAGLPLLVWEMWLKGADRSPLTLMVLLLPAAGFLFMMFGYPEPREIIGGSLTDILFALIYTVAIGAGAAAFIIGDRALLVRIGLAMVFMAVYFVLYTVPIGGARLIHGGADAKCLISLAALFPWYITGLPFQIGPFYSTLADIPSLGTIMPFHLSILFNAAVISALFVLVMILAVNVFKGNLKGLRPTSYLEDVDSIQGKFLWVITDDKEKKDPTPALVKELKRKGPDKVRVTPKIPFILYLFLGAIAQAVVGNLVVALLLI